MNMKTAWLTSTQCRKLWYVLGRYSPRTCGTVRSTHGGDMHRSAVQLDGRGSRHGKASGSCTACQPQPQPSAACLVHKAPQRGDVHKAGRLVALGARVGTAARGLIARGRQG